MSDILKEAIAAAEREGKVELPVRVQVLMEGAKLTNGDRNGAYGDPSINLGCAGELKEIIRKYVNTARVFHPGEVEAIDLVLTKISRIVTGAIVKRDNYTDGAVYLAIAGEIGINHAAKLAQDKMVDGLKEHKPGAIVEVPPGYKFGK